MGGFGLRSVGDRGTPPLCRLVPTLWESINAGKKLQAFIFGGANVLILWFAVLGSQAAADKIT
jgi:hypothetical protein